MGMAKSFSEDSIVRLRIADDIASSCPNDVGVEIAVTGSTSRGEADAQSDIELNFWVSALPEEWSERTRWLKHHTEWLRGLPDITELYIDQTPIADGSVWLSFKYSQCWVEAGWQDVQIQEKLLNSIVEGENIDHELIVLADTLQHAIPIRQAGHLKFWKHKLEVYSPILRERLIQDCLDAWVFPLHIESCWRWDGGYFFKFREHLLGDLERCLRIVFAYNRIWEPEWKRLDSRAESLEYCPPRLVERIRDILETDNPLSARQKCNELIHDVLVQISPEFCVHRPLSLIDRSRPPKGLL